jgi:chorismate mutase
MQIHKAVNPDSVELEANLALIAVVGDSSEMIEQIERLKGVRYLKILSSDASI